MATSSDMEERLMEIEALKAIYEHEFNTFNVESSVICQVKLKESDAMVTFSLPDNYPHGVPDISAVKRGSCMRALESYLQNVAKDLRGEVMIYPLVEEAKMWIRKSEPSETKESPIDDQKKSAKPEEVSVCQFFLSGKCRFGSKCFNKHEIPDKGDPSLKEASLHSKMERLQLANPTQAEPQEVVEETGILNSKGSGTSSKKKSMKTASDVISRIQWDENLCESDFVVGYLDRFVGIVEKCFGEFSWEDIASVDYNTLSIPQHRIQYFKYCDQVVWDKRERMDRVFGSTGSGETILDVMRTLRPGKELHGLDQAHIQDQVTMTTRDEVHTCELENDTSGPNYFVAVEITDDGLCEQVQKLQQSICTMESSLACDIIARSRLHVTLVMLTLKNEDDVISAKQVLKAIQPVMTSLLPPTHPLDFQGLSSFKGHVLYVPVKSDPGLATLVEAIKYKFHQAGICLEGNQETFVPHMTVLRNVRSHMTPAQVQEIFTSLETSYSGYAFGHNSISSLALCSKSAPCNPSSYKVVTVENSLSALSSTLPTKLLQHLDNLYMEKACSESDRDQLHSLLTSTNTCDMEYAFSKLTRLSQDRISSESSEQDRVLLILRGIHGSGKTYLAENSVEAKEQGRVRICGSQQLFQRRSGAAFVDPSEMSIAEAYCRTQFLEALESLVQLVVIDGVHSQLWEYIVYKRVARAFGYTCHVLELRCLEPEDIQACHQYCSSHQSLDQLLDLAQSWQHDSKAVAIEPWFKEPLINRGTGKSLLKLIGLGEGNHA